MLPFRGEFSEQRSGFALRLGCNAFDSAAGRGVCAHS
jgi:hypothetical protein